MTTVSLLVDHYSMIYKEDKKPKLYGRKGEVVSIVSKSGQVLIVEKSNGDRFPIRIDNVR